MTNIIVNEKNKDRISAYLVAANGVVAPGYSLVWYNYVSVFYPLRGVVAPGYSLVWYNHALHGTHTAASCSSRLFLGMV